MIINKTIHSIICLTLSSQDITVCILYVCSLRNTIARYMVLHVCSLRNTCVVRYIVLHVYSLRNTCVTSYMVPNYHVGLFSLVRAIPIVVDYSLINIYIFYAIVNKENHHVGLFSLIGTIPIAAHYPLINI